MTLSAQYIVFGGAGFIGTRLCTRLRGRNAPFTIIDLKQSRRFPENSRIADIRDKSQITEALRGLPPSATIIHLAAVHRDDVRDRRLYHDVNVTGTRNVCEAAAEHGIDHIVFTSSVAVYGYAPVGTGENGAIAPYNEYGKTKFLAEKELERWHDESSATRSVVVVRPTVVFGEGNRGNVFNLLNQIASRRFVMIGAGRNVKSMAYVENVAAFLELAANSRGGFARVNYTDGPDMDMNTLVSLLRENLLGRRGVGVRLPYGLGLALGHVADGVSRITGMRLPVSAIRVRKFCADSSFSSSKGNYENFVAPVSLQQGLLNTLDSEFRSPDPEREIFFTE